MYIFTNKSIMMIKAYGTIILIFTTVLFSFGQKEWTLQECIQFALDNNIQIKQQELNAEYSKNSHLQSELSLLPTLNGFTMFQSNYGTAVDPFTSSFSPNNVYSGNVSVSSSMTLFSGLQRINTIQQKKLDLMATLQDLEKTRNDISLNIASSYLQILFSMELLDIAKNQLEITKQQVDRTKKLVEAGSLAQGSLLEIEAQEAGEELQVVNADNQLTMAYLTMKQLLLLDSANSYSFQILKPLMPEIKEQDLHIRAEDIYREALNNLPQIKSSEIRLQSAEKGLNIAQGGRSPRLSANATWWGSGYSSSLKLPDMSTISMDTVLSGFTSGGDQVYSYSYDYESVAQPWKDQLGDNKSTTFSVSLSIPIFNGWQVNTNISNARINVLNARYQLENSKNQLFREIQQAHADAVAALKKYHATQKASSSMEEAFMYTQQKFNVGLVNSVDFNLAKNQLIKAKSDLLQAKYEYIFKTKILDFYMGNPILL